MIGAWKGVFPSHVFARAARQETRGNDNCFGIPSARYALLLVWHHHYSRRDPREIEHRQVAAYRPFLRTRLHC